MRSLIVLCVLIAIAAAAPQGNPNEVQLVSYTNENDGLGNYQFAYELTDGTRRQEQGELKEVPGAEEPVVVQSGSWSFVAPDGQTYWVRFTADENGYHPVVGTGNPQ